jgi:hypothetical protein
MSCHSAYLLGNTIEVRARPTDGSAVEDAADWTLIVLPPNQSESTAYPMVAVDGRAVASFVPDAPGRWRYRVELAAPVLSAFESYVDVRARSVPAPV